MRETLEKVKPPNGGREVRGLLPARRTPAPPFTTLPVTVSAGVVRSDQRGQEEDAV